jgi:oxygen-independent coproporphyrinogen-3 oxidase
LNIIENKFSKSERKRIEDGIKNYIDKGQMILKQQNLILTDDGKLFADGIASDLFIDSPKL